MGRISTKKMNLRVEITFIYLNVTNPLIIPLIFIFLSCREKAHDNRELSRENSKLRHES